MKFLILILSLVATSASAQSISPLTQEFGKGKAKSQFTVVNTTLTPDVVMIQPRMLSFTPNGQMMIGELAPGVHVELSEMSTKLGPRQQHVFSYSISCLRDCAVALFATFSNGQKVAGTGFQIAVHLPTSNYVCQDKAKGCRERLRKSWGLAR